MQSTIYDLLLGSLPAGSSGKTSQAPSTPTTTPSGVSWAQLADTVAPSMRLAGEAGPTRVWLLDPAAPPLGGYWTPSISAWPSGADASSCSLAEVLERGTVPTRYFLSAKAAAGILRRAEVRGKTLPPTLRMALEATATSGDALSEATGGGHRYDAESETLIAAPLGAPAGGSGWRGDLDHETFLPVARTLGAQANASHRADTDTYVAHTLRGEGLDAGEDGTGRGTPLVPVTVGSLLNGGRTAGSATTQDARSGLLVPLAFNARQDPTSGPVADALGTKDNGHGVLYYSHDYNQDRIYGTNAPAPALTAADSNRSRNVFAGMAVRRLLPVECERLMGFPDDYTQIPARPVPAKGQVLARLRLAAGDERFHEVDGVVWITSSDGSRYRALGNSMAVPVIRWIGQRIGTCTAADREPERVNL
jgi:DNA (cytosine-5)-methyltransferase 1